MITAVVLALLAVVWLVVLVPPAVRSRSANRNTSVESFQSQLSVLEKRQADLRRETPTPSSPPTLIGLASPPVNGTDSAPPKAKSPLTAQGRARARRRQAFTALVIAAPITLGAAIMLGGWFTLAHVAVDIALISLVGWLLRAQRISAEKEMKVAFLPHADAGAEPTMLLESVSNS